MTFGSFVKHQFMGKQGRRNLNFVRKQGRAILPGLTRRIEKGVGKSRKWINALAGIGRAGTDAMDAFQRTDVPGFVDALGGGAKATHKLGKEIYHDPDVRAAAGKVKGAVQKAGRFLKRGKKRRANISVGTMESPNRGKQARIGPEALARIVRTAQN
jgi:hypothetical protein